MLKTRVITASILIPVMVGLVLFAPVWLFALVIGGGLLLGAWEWSHLIGWQHNAARIAYVLATAAALLATWWLDFWLIQSLVLVAMWVLILFWFAAPGFGQRNGAGMVLLKSVVGLVTYSGALAACLLLHAAEGGEYWLLAVMLMVWAADSGAYFAGRWLGQRKLAPRISPGKTWAGLVGGVLSGVIALALCAWYLQVSGQTLLWLCAIAVLVVLFSVAGDLFVSLVKRQVGAKDTGSLLPGHGGILDRIDSMLAAIPVFAVALVWLGLI